MEQFAKFLINHWALSATFITVLITLLILELYKKSGPKQLSVHGVVDLINHQSALIVDLRAKDVYSKGHIAGAINYDAGFQDFDGIIKLAKKHKEKPIVLACKNGNDSLKLISKLSKESSGNFIQLNGGMLAWSNAGMPVVTD